MTTIYVRRSKVLRLLKSGCGFCIISSVYGQNDIDCKFNLDRLYSWTFVSKPGLVLHSHRWRQLRTNWWYERACICFQICKMINLNINKDLRQRQTEKERRSNSQPCVVRLFKREFEFSFKVNKVRSNQWTGNLYHPLFCSLLVVGVIGGWFALKDTSLHLTSTSRGTLRRESHPELYDKDGKLNRGDYLTLNLNQDMIQKTSSRRHLPDEEMWQTGGAPPPFHSIMRITIETTRRS